MKIGILGYGKEGKSAEQYFQKQNAKIDVFDNFTNEELENRDFSTYDLILRSPSVHPQENFSSMTRYFFEHCPCPIIGVTGTKGKGTTSSLITDLLKQIYQNQQLHQNVYLVGNIGNPALDVLDSLQKTDVVVYEMSSFQLWDLEKSPHICIVLGIEPDHLNVHNDYDEYVAAKANISSHQTSSDFCIYYKENPDSVKIANLSPAKKLPYPSHDPLLEETVQHLAIPGRHNRENAEAALLAVTSFLDLSLAGFIKQNRSAVIKTLENFRGLPHRLEYLRTIDNIKYYDDNFSTTPTSLKVALEAFPDQNLILIAGGRDKTDNQDLPEITALINNTPNLKKTILIGESGRELTKVITNHEYANTLEEAVALAKSSAEQLNADVVLMSPAAASFDMFENVYDRGAKFQKIIQDLQ